jgi:hypothetical protein
MPFVDGKPFYKGEKEEERGKEGKGAQEAKAICSISR